MSYYGPTDYVVDGDFVQRMKDIRRGDLDLSWLQAGTEQIQVNAENARRGLTYLDLNRGSYGFDALPEMLRGPRGAAPRGAAYDVAEQADLGPELNRKSDVWAYKVASFTEEAMSRQWDALRRWLVKNGELPSDDTQVYFLEAIGLNRIKIGSSVDPPKRLSSLQTGSPVPLRCPWRRR